MNSKASFPFQVLFISSLLALALATIDKEQHKIYFSYDGARGPGNWGKLEPDFSACSSGKRQSPVNINTTSCLLNNNLKPFFKHYSYSHAHQANATLLNWGFIIGLQFDKDIGSLEIHGKKYFFKQMHWHSPSEHLLDGIRYPAEAHLVHKAEDGTAAVIAILFKYSNSTDPLLAKLSDGLKKLNLDKNVSQVGVGIVNTNILGSSIRKYYRYLGSFTTPPCTENVTWTILGKVRLIRKEQIEALEAPLDRECKHNARPAQHLNGRTIELYDRVL